MDLGARKAIEYSGFNGIFCGGLKDKNVQSEADGSGLTYDDLEGSKDHLCGILY